MNFLFHREFGIMYNVKESLSIINCTSSLISYANDDRVSYSYHSTYRRRRDSDSAVHYYIPHGSINITQNDTDPYLPSVTKFRRIFVVSLFPLCNPRYRSRSFFPSIDCRGFPLNEILSTTTADRRSANLGEFNSIQRRRELQYLYSPKTIYRPIDRCSSIDDHRTLGVVFCRI